MFKWLLASAGVVAFLVYRGRKASTTPDGDAIEPQVQPQVQPQPKLPQTPIKVAPLKGSNTATLKWPTRVLFIGDSLSVGAAPAFEKIFRFNGVTDFNSIGVVGSTIPQWANGKHTASLDDALTKFKPDLVLISLGTNDESGRRPRYGGASYNVAAATAKYLVPLQQKIARAGANSIWLGPPAVSPKLWEMDQNFRKILAKTWDNLYFDSATVPFTKVKDGVHLTRGDNELWADEVLRWMQPRLAPLNI